MDTIKKIFLRKKVIWLICYPISFIILFIVKQSTYIAEHIFAKGIYKFISQTVSIITGVLPFSIAEVIVLLSPIILILLFTVWVIKIIKTKGKRGYILTDGLLNVFIAAGIFILVFMLGCGVNYYRYPFSYYADLQVKESSKEELYALCLDLATQANDVRDLLTSYCENEYGVYELGISKRELGKKAQKSYATSSKLYPILSGRYPAPKHIMLSHSLSKTGITGIFIPFTMEANVNVDIPDYSIVSTMCHELAHLHGFIREDEANYISYLVCVNSGDLDLIYSGLMEALILSGNALYKKDKELYFAVRDTYSEGVLRDLKDNSEYWKQFEDEKANEVAEKVNDTYLKINNQADGIQSYGRMVDLLLAEYRKRNAY